MIDYLLNIITKGNKNYKDPKVRESVGVFSSVMGIGCNILLFVVKLLVGVMSNSISIIADSFNNLSDCMSAIISLVGVKLAMRPADDEHPFGHGRYEYIASLVVAFVIMIIGWQFLMSSISAIKNKESMQASTVAIFVLISTVVIKMVLSYINFGLGKKINSIVLVATAKDSRNDVIITGSTLLSMIVTSVSGVVIDGYVGVLVSIMLMYSGFGVAMETVSTLLGEAIDDDTKVIVREKVNGYDIVIGTHDLIIHNYGPTKLIATIHAEVDGTKDINEIHEAIDKIERDVYRDLDISLTIHIDPIDITDERIANIMQVVYGVIETESGVDIHDFRIVDAGAHSNVIFEIHIPYNMSNSKRKSMLTKIKKSVCEINQRYVCIMNVEYGI